MQTTSTYDTQTLARRLNSLDEAEREQAQADLRALLAADVRRISHVRRAQSVTISLYLLLVLLYCIRTVTSGQDLNNGIIISASVACTGVQHLISLFARQSARRIAALDIPQAGGPLIEMLISQGFFQSQHVKSALIRLLPRLRPNDAGLLTPLHRRHLGSMLRSDEIFPYHGRLWGKDLKIAILSALEQVGDQKSVAQVEKTARSAHDVYVRFAAQQCLPFLQERVEHSRIEQTLLRPSAQSHAPDTLLRPASATTSVESPMLLRAANSHSADDAD